MLARKFIDLDGKQVMLETLNANEIRATAVKCGITSVNIWGNYYSEVNFSDILILKEHENLAVDINGITHIYNIARITEQSSTSFLINHTIPTKTNLFLLPTLGNFKDDFATNIFLINSYLNRNHKSLFLVYRFIPGEMFKLLDNFLRSNEKLVRVLNPEYNTIVYEMEIPDWYYKDITSFINGEYSRFSDKLKKRILTFHKFNQHGETYKILYKDSVRRKQLEIDLGVTLPENIELFDIPEMENEYFKLIEPS